MLELKFLEMVALQTYAQFACFRTSDEAVNELLFLEKKYKISNNCI